MWFSGCLTLLICDYVAELWSLASVISVFGMLAIVLGTSMGPAPVSAYIFGELTPQASRSITGSATIFFHLLPGILVTSFYPPLYTSIGPLALLFLLVPNTVILIYFSICLPETRGRPVDEIVAGFKGNSNDDEEVEFLLH